MPAKVISATGDTTLAEAAGRQILEITELIIDNGATANATVTIKDVYTDVNGNDIERELIVKNVAAGGSFEITELRGEKVYGSLVINTNQQPLNVTYGLRRL